MKLACALGCCAFIVAVAGARANADGAFPNSQSILLPVGQPSEIRLVTNFGVVTSEDAGRSWLWSCESDANALGLLYQESGPPRNRIYALANQQIVFSDDGTCGWQSAGGALGSEAATDYFLDPSDPDRVVAVGLPDGGNYEVLESDDAGATFDKILYQANPGDFITGVEIAASDPRTIYLAISRSDGIALGRSSDGGASWTITDLTAQLNASVVRIVSVDPGDATRALLLAIQSGSASIVLATNGGATLGTPLTMPAVFNSFARLASGTLLVGGQLTSGTPVLFRSRDGGQSFQQVSNPPAVVGLAARDSRVYAALDYMSVHSALAASDDEGNTWTNVMTFSDVQAVLPCVKATCRTVCETEAMSGIWPEQVCTADPAPSSGADAGGANPGGGSDGATGGRGGEAGASRQASHGCEIGDGPMDSAEMFGTIVFLFAAWCRRRTAGRRPPPAVLGLSVLMAVAGCAGSGSLRRGDAGASSDGPAIAATVTVTRGTVTGHLGPGYVGLSFEKSHLTDGFFTADHAPLVALFKLLGPSVVRIGANDVDSSVWTPGATPVAAGTTSHDVGTVEVDALAGFLSATGWQVIYGVNMKTSTPAAAAAEASYAAMRLGASLSALEIGNEINFYGSYATVGPRWETFADAVHAMVPGLPLAGPASGADPSFDVPFAHDEASRIVLLTHHYYRGAAGSAAATMANLLAPDPGMLNQGRTMSTAATANQIRDGFRWGEMNSFSGHGQAGVSDTFGSALWSIDFMLTAAQLAGCTGVNFHGGGQNEDGNSCPNGPSSCTRPFRYSPIVEVDSRVTGAAPLFYGLLLVAQAGTGDVLQTQISGGTLNFTAYAIAPADGSTSVVLVNKDATTGVNASVDLGAAAGTASAIFLRGPSLDAPSGMTLGEAGITAAGVWTPAAPHDLPTSGQVTSVVVPPATAVLVRAR